MANKKKQLFQKSAFLAVMKLFKEFMSIDTFNRKDFRKILISYSKISYQSFRSLLPELELKEIINLKDKTIQLTEKGKKVRDCLFLLIKYINEPTPATKAQIHLIKKVIKK